jgi:hypothetical protein
MTEHQHLFTHSSTSRERFPIAEGKVPTIDAAVKWLQPIRHQHMISKA